MSEQMKKIDKNNIANILGLTTIQEGLLFHHLMEPEGNAYFEQMLIKLESEPARDLLKKHGSKRFSKMKCCGRCLGGRKQLSQFK
ncbi:hypothetical protein QO179_08175 [Bacillus stercoris]|nr:hypothetical protein [Bacillus stercoris]